MVYWAQALKGSERENEKKGLPLFLFTTKRNNLGYIEDHWNHFK